MTIINIEDNIKLVWKVYKDIYHSLDHRFNERMDFFQSGCIGLISAVRLYDALKGEFSTYAYKAIMGQMKRLNAYSIRFDREIIINTDNNNDDNIDMLDIYNMVLNTDLTEKQRFVINKMYKEELSTKEIAALMNVSVQRVNELKNISLKRIRKQYRQLINEFKN